ncbi:MAG: ribosome recycling factor [Gemmatimonadetes bacterium]|nr:ribosome recycling factor [Gemmatimonadota bacterium]
MPSVREAKSQMEKAVEAVRREFSGVRTSKATPALLDTIRVDAYGSKMPVNQVATVSAPEPRLLVVQPWDQSLVPVVEKAIRTGDLGLNPATEGGVIRVPIPPLTEERRKELVRVLHKLAEEGRVAVRHARQEANKDIKRKKDTHEISEDDAERELKEVQKLTDDFISKIDQLLKSKEAEVMEV